MSGKRDEHPRVARPAPRLLAAVEAAGERNWAGWPAHDGPNGGCSATGAAIGS